MSKIPCRLNKREQAQLRRVGSIEVERSRRIAYGGDWIELDARCYVLTDVRTCTNLSHSHKRIAFAHTFKNQAQLCQFHVHQLDRGVCIHCGFRASQEVEV